MGINKYKKQCYNSNMFKHCKIKDTVKFLKKDLCYIDTKDGICIALKCKIVDGIIKSVFILSETNFVDVDNLQILYKGISYQLKNGLPDLTQYIDSRNKVKNYFKSKRLQNLDKLTAYSLEELENIEILYNESKNKFMLNKINVDLEKI